MNRKSETSFLGGLAALLFGAWLLWTVFPDFKRYLRIKQM